MYFKRDSLGEGNLNKFIRRADALSDEPVPEDAQEWEDAMLRYAKKVHDIDGGQSIAMGTVKKTKTRRRGMVMKKPKKRMEKYLKTWSLRARFASRWLAMSKGKKFDCCGFSAKRFSRLVPDTGNWMVKFLPRGVYSMKALAKRVKFSGVRSQFHAVYIVPSGRA